MGELSFRIFRRSVLNFRRTVLIFRQNGSHLSTNGYHLSAIGSHPFWRLVLICFGDWFSSFDERLSSFGDRLSSFGDWLSSFGDRFSTSHLLAIGYHLSGINPRRYGNWRNSFKKSKKIKQITIIDRS